MIKPVKNNKQYKEGLSRIYQLMQKNLKPNSVESDELEILSLLVKEYENINYSIPKPNPIEAIRFRLEQKGLTEVDLSRIIGYRSRKSEILSGKRKLSLAMIRKLNEELEIPAEVLIQAY
jgi:HTH-type transcriptional regulator/antitoxin HigA